MHRSLVSASLSAALLIGAPIASADDPRKQPSSASRPDAPSQSGTAAQPGTTQPGTTAQSGKPTTPTQGAKAPTASKPKDAGPAAADVMKSTQEALTQIDRAQRALERGDRKAARTALARSEKTLEKLYDTPAMASLMNELDEAISSLATGTQVTEPVDLAPLSSQVSEQRVFIDPEVAAGITSAEEKAKRGEREAAADDLRLAQSRLSADVAYLPVQEAYARVIAAQSLIEDRKIDQAQRLLRSVPVLVGTVQLSAPMVPVRFSLHAAAAAAEAGETQRASQLIKDAAAQLDRVEQMTRDDQASQELAPISSDLDRLEQRADRGQRLDPAELRSLARKTRDIGQG